MVEWHHHLNGHKFEQTPGADEGQRKPGVLQSLGPWKESNTTEQQLQNILVLLSIWLIAF